MARGWESKDVESRIQDASERTPRNQPQVSSEERARVTRLQHFELERARILQEKRSTANPRFRALLDRELAWVDAELKKLDQPG